MSERKPIKTSVEEVVAYWTRHQDECGLSVDWAEAHERCWRCGCQKNLERCHIVPDSLGGKDEASNLVLLCKRCHAEGPNVEDPEIMWDWIRAYGVPFYDTFWKIMGRIEYKFIYGHRMDDDLKKIVELSKHAVEKEELERMYQTKLSKAINRTSIHFGQPYLNTATMAGVYRMFLKDMAKELDVEFPVKDEEMKKKMPWWVG